MSEAAFTLDTMQYVRLNGTSLLKTEIVSNIYVCCSQPLHNEEVGELRPFENGKRFYVDVTNDGFKLAKNLHQKAFDFWSNVELRAYEFNTAHEEL